MGESRRRVEVRDPLAAVRGVNPLEEPIELLAHPPRDRVTGIRTAVLRTRCASSSSRKQRKEARRLQGETRVERWFVIKVSPPGPSFQLANRTSRPAFAPQCGVLRG